jgi:hypothetical protein
MMSENELSKKIVGITDVPAFLQNKDVLGTEQLDQYVRPPRLKIVQAQSKPPYDTYEPGTVLLVPQNITFAEFERVTREGKPFKFVPLFFYPEWIKTNPLGMEPFIIERSIDPRSDLAMKARNKETWHEPHPTDPGKQVSNREVLNFVVMPYQSPQFDTMCVMTFSKAEFKTGSNLAQMIKMRKQSIFAQVFEAKVVPKGNSKGNWHGFSIDIPESSAWVTEDEHSVFLDLYEALKDVYAKGLLQVDHDEAVGSASTAESTDF